jgi:hypothetical protein
MLLEGSNASTVLTWVRPDLDKHLNQIQAQIEHLAQSKIIGDGVENTAEHLLQLKFTFEALVLNGATLVVEEMITVCEELKQQKVRDRKKCVWHNVVRHRGTTLLPGPHAGRQSLPADFVSSF